MPEASITKRKVFTQYKTGSNEGGHEWHEWACIAADRSCAVHVWMQWSSSGWYGGVEKHETPKNGAEPDHKMCHLLLGPCLHDGSSLYFEECWKASCVNAVFSRLPLFVIPRVEMEFHERFPLGDEDGKA